ncbi:MAG: GxxExxY protein [Prevotella sp.]|nr:GxxExxY protein [Prevotella sp.]
MEIESLIKEIVQCVYSVRGQLPAGFLENVYKNALFIELKKHHLQVETEVPIKIHYDDIVVGEYRADMIVEKQVILELKAVNILCLAHEVQLVNYLTALRIDNGLLVNFGGEKIEVKRKYRKYKKSIKY